VSKTAFRWPRAFPSAPTPEALASSPIVRTEDQLARRIEIVTWPRPPIPEHILIEGTPGGQIKAA